MHTALTIAGSDSSGGAGIQADLRTFASLGVYGLSAITAVTAQNTLGVVRVLPLPADMVSAQIEAVAGDIEIHATKVGMLANAAITEAVAAAIESLDLPVVVLDPVLQSTSGHMLLDDDGLQTLMRELMPRVRVITPNIAEAERLTGRGIRSVGDARDAARQLHDRGARGVVITGLHEVANRAGDSTPGTDAVDLVFDGGSFQECRMPLIAHGETHGTGCAHASALSAYLALGHDLLEAAARAQRFVAEAMRGSISIGRGARLIGPNVY